MKPTLLLLVVLLVSISGWAKKVDPETAAVAAKNMYYERVNQIKNVEYNDIKLNISYIASEKNEPLYYVFNIENNGGFVIVSADDVVKPLIGYSFEGTFPKDNWIPSFQEWMNHYTDQIKYARNNQIAASEKIAMEWQSAMVKKTTTTKGAKSITPLLLTQWNQSTPYNESCPADAAGSGGHVVVGCVALSMAQAMKFYNYPATGEGSHTNYSYWNGGYGNKTVNFAAQNYKWENMPLTMTRDNAFLADLLYHCGVAVDMNWGPDGSASSTQNIVDALEDYYKYSTDAQFVSKSNYSSANWISTLKNQIDHKWPMVYTGSDTDGGHAWNCDAYQNDEFHMNWGWGGYADGYFTLDNLAAGSYDFTSFQGAVINIYPRSGYPEGCLSPAKMITGDDGSFNDGSGNENYDNNLDCRYLIQPNCGCYIDLNFDRMDLGSGDVINIYDGSSTSDPLLASYTSANVPSVYTYSNSTGNSMLIQFITDGSDNAEGWYASYKVSYCKGTVTINAASGSISDGSSSCDYRPTTLCTWELAPDNVNHFDINFTEFDLDNTDTYDYVQVYLNSISSSNLYGTFNHTNAPSTLSLDASKVYVRFKSNSLNNGGGWTMTYNAYTGIQDEVASEYKLAVMPNPFSGQANIQFSLPEQTPVQIQLTNLLGQELGVLQRNFTAGTHQVQLSELAENLESGVYLLNLQLGEDYTTIKVICTK